MAENTRELFRLESQVAVITGAAGLLGEQHAQALSDFGAHLILADIKKDPCIELARQIEAQKHIKALALSCDVTQKSSWEEILTITLEKFGHVDILLNNAAFTTESPSAHYSAPLSDFPLEDWQQILGVNLTGTFLG